MARDHLPEVDEIVRLFGLRVTMTTDQTLAHIEEVKARLVEMQAAPGGPAMTEPLSDEALDALPEVAQAKEAAFQAARDYCEATQYVEFLENAYREFGDMLRTMEAYEAARSRAISLIEQRQEGQA